MLRRLLVAAVLAVPFLAIGGTAQAAACGGTSGVTVIVQFGDGHTVSACADGDPSSGLDALHRAGFSTTFAPRNPGFVCTINGSPGDKNCMKPNYWAYFHAKRGGSWSYSSSGAGSYNPAPGSVEGWRFGGGAKPSTPPPGAVSTPKPTPTQAPKPSTRPAPKPGAKATARTGTPKAKSTAKVLASGKGKAAGATGGPSASATASAAATQGAAGRGQHSPSAAASPSATSASPGTAVADAPKAKQVGVQDEQSGGLAWWWGLLALAVLGGGAGAITLARRRKAT